MGRTAAPGSVTSGHLGLSSFNAVEGSFLEYLIHSENENLVAARFSALYFFFNGSPFRGATVRSVRNREDTPNSERTLLILNKFVKFN